MQGMPDILPIGMQDILHRSKPKMREKTLTANFIPIKTSDDGNAARHFHFSRNEINENDE
jgi:hypothetical protein